MQSRGIDALVLTPGAAMQYLTGFSEEAYERLLCLIVRAETEVATFVVPALNMDQAQANPAKISRVLPWTDSQGWETTLSAQFHHHGASTVGVDDNMPARFLLPIQRILPNASVVSGGLVIVDLRSVKDNNELDAMRRAARLTDLAYHAAVNACRPGCTETDLARVIEETILQAGGELAFPTIVGSGPNSALPHYAAGSRVISEGDIVLLDLGARVDGYCGDITRVVSAGPPKAECAEIYNIVYRAHANAVRAVKPGVNAQSIDFAARTIVERAGFAEQFFHRTGHGIGIEEHESPNIVHGNAYELRAGNCFSIEPGIYLTGKFGVRLENIVAVAESGCEVLNEAIPPNLMDVADLRS